MNPVAATANAPVLRSGVLTLANGYDACMPQRNTSAPLPALDRIAELHGTSGLRRAMAEEPAPPEEVAPLLEIAAEHGAGLCPVCFAELAATVTPLPPLDLANGRLSGDGYAVRLGSNAGVRTLTVSTPDLPPSPDGITLAPRTTATLAASLIVLGALLISPTHAMIALGLAATVYLGVLLPHLRHDPDEQAVEVAWQRLAPGLAEREHAVRFLTRLCLASLGRGNAEQRVAVLANIVARAAGRAGGSNAELQLLAASQVLQVEDAIRLGRDAVAGVASLAATGFTGELSAEFAEFVVGAYLTRDRPAGDLLRLRILLLATAFETGLMPRDLATLWVAAPNLKRVMSVEPANRLALLHGLWRTRDAHAWHSVGHGDTVFDLARKLPRHAAGVLERFPDLLLSHRPERAVEDLIGPVLICARGVAIGDHLLADPDAEVRLESRGRVLIFGRHRIEVRRPLPDDLPDTVSGWLQFRAQWLLTLGEGGFDAGRLAVSQRVLAPFCRRCNNCEAVSTMGYGSVGCTINA